MNGRSKLGTVLCMVLVISSCEASGATVVTGYESQFICIFEEEERFESGGWITDKEITLKFRLEISLYGRMYGIGRVFTQDRLVFWLDDVKICLLCTYDTPNPSEYCCQQLLL